VNEVDAAMFGFVLTVGLISLGVDWLREVIRRTGD